MGNKALTLAIETARSAHDTLKPNASSYLGAFFPKLEGNSQRLSDLNKLPPHQLREKFLKTVRSGGLRPRLEFALRDGSPLQRLVYRIYRNDLNESPFSSKEFHASFTEALADDFREEATGIPSMWNDYEDLVRKHRECTDDEYRRVFAGGAVLLVFTAALLGPAAAKMELFGYTRNISSTEPPSAGPSGRASLNDVLIELVDGFFTAGSTFVVLGAMRHVISWRKPAVIGRNPRQKGKELIEIEDTTPGLSREHVEIYYSRRKWFVKDISSYGTFLIRRGELIDLRQKADREEVLEPGDVIMLHVEATGFLVQPLS